MNGQVSMVHFEVYAAKRRAMDTAVSILWPRAKEIASKKVSELPIAKDEHALNVKTDCALRAGLVQYYGGTRAELADLLEDELLHHPFWDDACRAATTPLYYLRMTASNTQSAKDKLQEYHLLLEAAAESVNEYLAAGNKLPAAQMENTIAGKSYIYVKHSGPIIVGNPITTPPESPNEDTTLTIESMDDFIKNLDAEDRTFAVDVIRTLLPSYQTQKEFIEGLIIPIIQTGQFPEESKLNELMRKFNVNGRDDLDMKLFNIIQRAFMQIELRSAGKK